MEQGLNFVEIETHLISIMPQVVVGVGVGIVVHPLFVAREESLRENESVENMWQNLVPATTQYTGISGANTISTNCKNNLYMLYLE